jgi:protein O-mannosyl-transferase
VHNNLGNVLSQMGQVDEAVAHYQKALQTEPDYAEARLNLGTVLLFKGLVHDGIAQYQLALKAKPDYVEARLILGKALAQNGRVDEAITQYQKALEISPDDVIALTRLGWLLATSPQASIRDGAKAVALATRAYQLSPGGNPTILRTLAAALAEVGRFPEAVAAAQQALQSPATQTNRALLDALQTQVGLYQAGSPYRDSPQTTAPPGQNQP